MKCWSIYYYCIIVSFFFRFPCQQALSVCPFILAAPVLLFMLLLFVVSKSARCCSGDGGVFSISSARACRRHVGLHSIFKLARCCVMPSPRQSQLKRSCEIIACFSKRVGVIVSRNAFFHIFTIIPLKGPYNIILFISTFFFVSENWWKHILKHSKVNSLPTTVFARVLTCWIHASKYMYILVHMHFFFKASCSTQISTFFLHYT